MKPAGRVRGCKGMARGIKPGAARSKHSAGERDPSITEALGG
jgi:hypothetical protein